MSKEKLIPIENERKYVLGIEMADDILKIKWDGNTRYFYSQQVQQGYLFGNNEMSARVRKSGDYHTFCFKKRAGDEFIEIEKKIPQSDFDSLWPSTTNRLRKIRHFIRSFVPKGEWEDSHGNIHRNCWEVDVFLDDEEKPYFVLAEHEMPEGKSEPDYFPAQIEPYLEYAVPRTRHGEFSSFLLGNKDYALSVEYPGRSE